MDSQEIMESFLDFFAQRRHLIVPSSSLIPSGDPTLLFTNAGMVQFKSYFAGEATPPQRRLASCQKCFRTTDIDEVGDTSHLTFFEMLGNFSIGDYFKKEAVALAWEFVTQNLGLAQDRLWISIYQEDDEAYQIWRKIGVPGERIVRLGKEDNFWGPAGATGPCGPDSEIFFDRGPESQKDAKDVQPSGESARFLEIWNLVFMEYHQDELGKLHPLPSKNIDTGMGLERISAVMQNVSTVYETDLFRPVRERAQEILRVEYGQHQETNRSLRIISEHGRAATFLIADGVMPANEGRGYVLRRILRKAIFHGRRLRREEPFLAEIAKAVIEKMSPRYPELRERSALVEQVVKGEEERFHRTLEVGSRLLQEVLDSPQAKNSGIIPGAEVFRLYDTYGLPFDFTRDMAGERGLQVDEQGFQKAMNEQKMRGRAVAKFELKKKAEILISLKLPATKFQGYETLESMANILAILHDGASISEAKVGDEVEVVLDQTPFYAEAGGQVGDSGAIIGRLGRAEVQDTQSPVEGSIVHYAKVIEGRVKVGDEVTAKVDGLRRWDIMRNHTATHLLHQALREILGPHALQAGSLVAPDRLRFDFTHPSPLSSEQWRSVEARVNAKIRENLPVQPKYMPYPEAVAQGAVALFGEKYGDVVRVISIDNYSRELCGGTHLTATGQIGFFTITSESSIGAGVRRLEALTGRGAEEYVRRSLGTLQDLGARLETPPPQILARVESLLQELEEQKKSVARLGQKTREEELAGILKQAKKVDGAVIISTMVVADSAQSLRAMSDFLREKAGSGAILLAAQIDGRNHFLAALTPDLVKKGLKAGEIVKKAALSAGGSGGGRANLAEGGGGDPRKMKEAIEMAREFIAQAIKQTKRRKG